MSNGVWHKNGPIAQILSMAEWAERGRTGDGIGAETAGKIADNLRAAVAALHLPSTDAPSTGDGLSVADQTKEDHHG